MIKDGKADIERKCDDEHTRKDDEKKGGKIATREITGECIQVGVTNRERKRRKIQRRRKREREGDEERMKKDREAVRNKKRDKHTAKITHFPSQGRRDRPPLE